MNDYKQPVKLALKNLIKEALTMVENGVDYTDSVQTSHLRDRLARAIGCAESLRTLEMLDKAAVVTGKPKP